MNYQEIINRIHQWFDETGKEILSKEAFEIRLQLMGIADGKRKPYVEKYFSRQIKQKLDGILNKTFNSAPRLMNFQQRQKLTDDLVQAKSQKIIAWIIETPHSHIQKIIDKLIEKEKQSKNFPQVFPLQKTLQTQQSKSKEFLEKFNDKELIHASEKAWKNLFLEMEKSKNIIEYLTTHETPSKIIEYMAYILMLIMVALSLAGQRDTPTYNTLRIGGGYFLPIIFLIILFSHLKNFYSIELSELTYQIKESIDEVARKYHQTQQTKTELSLLKSENLSAPGNNTSPPKAEDKPAPASTEGTPDSGNNKKSPSNKEKNNEEKDNEEKPKEPKTKTRGTPHPEVESKSTAHHEPGDSKEHQEPETEIKTGAEAEFYKTQLSKSANEIPSWLVKLRIPLGGSNYKETNYWIDTRAIKETVPDQVQKKFQATADAAILQSVTSKNKNCIKPYAFPFFRTDKNGVIHYYSHKIKCAGLAARVGCRNIDLGNKQFVLVPDFYDPTAHKREERLVHHTTPQPTALMRQRPRFS